jgi:hypothetical protein
MRSIYVLAALSCFTVVACDDDSSSPGSKDMAVGGHDMAVAHDLAVAGDLAVNGDLADLSAGADMSTGVTWAKFSLDFAHARCAQLMACGQVDATELDTCIAQNLQLTGWDIDTEITKGRLLLNETQCIAAVSAARCDSSDSGQWSQRCGTLLYVPEQNNGAVCLADVECTSSYCAHAANTAGTSPQPTGCPGVCATIKATGAACQTDDQCGSNSFCDNGNDAASTNTCMPYLGVGDPCGAITNPKQTCHPGTTYCPTFGTNPVCTAPAKSGALGDACDPAQAFADVPPCNADLYCKVDAGAGTCQPKTAAGQACNGNYTLTGLPYFYQFIDNQCADGTSCYSLDEDGNDTLGTCSPFGGLNDACKQITQTQSSCKIGFVCVTPGTSMVGTCQALVPTGAACVSGGLACAEATPVISGGVCIAESGDAGGAATCQTPKSFGDSCVPGYQDTLCWPTADPTTAYPTTSYCAPTSNGKGVCAPICN